MPLSERIVCVGDNCVDVTRHGPPTSPSRNPAAAGERTGGNAYNVAITLARHGWSVSYVGAVGDDAGAELILSAAADAGVEISHVERRRGATGRTVVEHDPGGERRFVSEDYGVAADYRLDAEVAAWLATARWLHFARQVDLADWGATLREGEATLSCDLGHDGGVDLLERVAPVMDVVFMSASSGAGHTPEQMLQRALAAGAPIAVVTLGSRGSIAAAGAARWQVDVYPVPRVLDTLGAGDAYIAGFIGARLKREGVEAAMRAGSRAGALACTRWGLADTAPIDEVLA